MPKWERRLLGSLDAYLPVLAAALATVLGVVIRLPLLDFVSGDSNFFLLPWYQQIQENGLSQQVGNYNFLYQLLIFLMTKLPIAPLHAYKWLSILFDYGLALAAGLLAARICPKERLLKGILAYCAVLLSPIVVLNSSAWAQCDSIFCCFAILALVALDQEKWGLSLVLMGLSFSFKLQAIFLLPVFLFVYYQRRRFSLLYFTLIPGTMLLTGLPLVFFGRNLLDIFSIYGGQTAAYPYLSMNYPSVWLLLSPGTDASHYTMLKVMAMGITLAVLAGLMLYWLQKKIPAKGENLLSMAFLLAYTCVLFLPAMHERYSYPFEILAIILALAMPKTAVLCAGLMGISLCTYGNYLYKIESLSPLTLTVINLLIYGAYVWYLNRKMKPTQ